MERKDVCKQIESEISYQKLKEGYKNNSISDYIIKIEHHLNEAKTSKYYLYENECLGRIRKIAALAMQCLEEYNCPERNVDPDRTINNNND